MEKYLIGIVKEFNIKLQAEEKVVKEKDEDKHLQREEIVVEEVVEEAE